MREKREKRRARRRTAIEPASASSARSERRRALTPLTCEIVSRQLGALELIDVRDNLLESLPAWVLRERNGLAVLAEGNPLRLELPPADASTRLFEDADFPADARSLFREGATAWAGQQACQEAWREAHTL